MGIDGGDAANLLSGFQVGPLMNEGPIRPAIQTRMSTILLSILCFASALVDQSLPLRSANANEINVYSHRQPFLINPFLKAFEKKTGIKVVVTC